MGLSRHCARRSSAGWPGATSRVGCELTADWVVDPSDQSRRDQHHVCHREIRFVPAISRRLKTPRPLKDQLARDAHTVAGFAHAAFEHVADAEFARHRLHIDCPALVLEARIARDNEKSRKTRDRGRNLLDDGVDEIVLLGIAGHVLERQHCQRGLIGQWKRRFGLGVLGDQNAVDADRPRDVLDLLLAGILEGEVELVAHLVAHDPADADPAGLRQGFEPGRDIDADAELDAALLGNAVIAQCHVALQPPKFDLISMLAHGEATRDLPSRPQEFMGNLLLLIVDGNDTTRNSISGGLWFLNQFPEEYAKLRADPG